MEQETYTEITFTKDPLGAARDTVRYFRTGVRPGVDHMEDGRLSLARHTTLQIGGIDDAKIFIQ